MNKFSIQSIQLLGYVIVVSAVLYSSYFAESTTVYGHIIHIPSMVLVGMGLFGFLLANNPFYQLKEIVRCIINLSSVSLNQRINKLSSVSKITDEYYQKGEEALLIHAKDNNIPETWRSAFEKIASKIPIDDVIQLVQFDYLQKYEKIDDSIYSLSRLSALAPSLGMFGTILGLIKLLDDLSDYANIGSDMSLALITTLYGILFSIAFIDPLINKLDVYKVIRRKNNDLLIWWLNAIKERKTTLYFKGSKLSPEEK